MAALIVGAIDQHAAHAHLAHLAEGDFDRAVTGRCVGNGLTHAAIKAAPNTASNYRFLAARNARELLPVVGVEKRRVCRRTALCPPGEANNDYAPKHYQAPEGESVFAHCGTRGVCMTCARIKKAPRFEGLKYRISP